MPEHRKRRSKVIICGMRRQYWNNEKSHAFEEII